MTQELIRSVFMPHLSSPPLAFGNDFAGVDLPAEANLNGRLAISTDGHSVSPLFFPGGDIGRLAVCGTVNDVAMSGAEPLYLTAAFLMEEGLPTAMLEEITRSMQIAAEEAGVQIIAGDTKVVEKGKGDGLFVTTTGVGWLPPGRMLGGELARPGDVVLISGTVGDHGIAVLAARGELGFQTEVRSDVAPLNHLVGRVLKAAPNTRVLRDPTRGGLATALNEIAAQSGVNIVVDETSIPLQPAVSAACEMLGFDPLYVANEGKVVVITPAEEAEAALQAMRAHTYGQMAARIGEVRAEPQARVLLKTSIGGRRVLDTLAGEMLPRIC